MVMLANGNLASDATVRLMSSMKSRPEPILVTVSLCSKFDEDDTQTTRSSVVGMQRS